MGIGFPFSQVRVSGGLTGMAGTHGLRHLVIVTGSWDEASLYTSWIRVSSETGPVLYGLIRSEHCHSIVGKKTVPMLGCF